MSTTRRMDGKCGGDGGVGGDIDHAVDDDDEFMAI